MQMIQQKLLLQCEICKKDMTKENFPVSLKCGKTLCSNCFDNMKRTNSKCPFDPTHEHLLEQKVKNLLIKNHIVSLSSNNPNPPSEKDKDDIFYKIIKTKKNNEFQTDKFIYNGALKDDKPFGQGKLIYSGIGIFTGEFNGYFHKGKGTILYDNGDSYEGEWEYFKKQNYGVLEFQNLDRYEGEFNNDLFDGKGKLILFDKNITYEGFWREGKKFGEFNIYNEFDELIKKENYENDIKIS